MPPLQFKICHNWLSIEQLVKCINSSLLLFCKEMEGIQNELNLAVNPRRVWLANLPPKTTEFSVLQLIRRFGELEDFEFPVHKAGGPLQGSTLGFCFFTYKKEESARRALKEYVKLSFLTFPKRKHT